MLKLGSIEIDPPALGNTELSKIYLGSDLVYQKQTYTATFSANYENLFWTNPVTYQITARPSGVTSYDFVISGETYHWLTSAYNYLPTVTEGNSVIVTRAYGIVTWKSKQLQTTDSTVVAWYYPKMVVNLTYSKVETAYRITASVKESGSYIDYFTDVSYKWYYSTDGSSFKVGGKSATYSPVVVPGTTRYYYVEVTMSDDTGEEKTFTSAVKSITVPS